MKKNDKNLKNSSSLPRLNVKNFKINNNNDIYNDTLKLLFKDEEIDRIKTIFKNDNDLLEIFVNKINILNKSKESSNKINNYEKNKLNEKIISMQKQIENLEKKIKEKEMEINIQKAEKNQNNDINKKLIEKLKYLNMKNTKNEEMKSNSQFTINENNLDEIDNILYNLDKNNMDIINNQKFFEKDLFDDFDETNKIIKEDKNNDNKIFIKIIKK